MALGDFNFLFGRWRIHNRVLLTRFEGDGDWCEFEATFDCRSLGLLGNVGHYRAVCNGEPLEGVSLRLYDPRSGMWTIRWADTPRPGTIQPPVMGKFEGFRAIFYGNAFYDARPVRVRAIWTRGPRPRFEQAFSLDRGRTWETNWIMNLTPVNARETDRARVGSAMALGAGQQQPIAETW